MVLRFVVVVSLVAIGAGCRDEPMTKEEVYHFKKLHDRPTEIDTSTVEQFELQIDGEDGFTGHPQVVYREPMILTGRIQLKEGVLTTLTYGSLRAGYRKIENGTADWSLDESTFQEFNIKSLSLDDGDNDDVWKIDRAITKMQPKPGKYELRYYLILEEFTTDPTNEVVGIYYLADGQLEILPADEAENE